MTALPSKADIKLNLGKRAAYDPKRTFFVDVIRLQMWAICSLLNYAYFTIPTKAKPARKTAQAAYRL